MTQHQKVALQGWPDERASTTSESRDRFRQNLARIMAERGVTQAGLARTMNVSRVAVHAWIWGTCFPETSRLLKLAQALNVQVGVLLEGGAGSAETEIANEEALLLDAFRKMPSTARLSLLADVYERSAKAAWSGTLDALESRE